MYFKAFKNCLLEKKQKIEPALSSPQKNEGNTPISGSILSLIVCLESWSLIWLDLCSNCWICWHGGSSNGADDNGSDSSSRLTGTSCRETAPESLIDCGFHHKFVCRVQDSFLMGRVPVKTSQIQWWNMIKHSFTFDFLRDKWFLKSDKCLLFFRFFFLLLFLKRVNLA